MFLSRIKKTNVYPCKPQFYYIKVGFKAVKIIQACFRDGSANAHQNVQLRRLIRVFTHRTRRFVTPSDRRRYTRLAKALIRRSLSVQADPSLRTSFIVGFAMHRLMHDLFVQTLTLGTLCLIFSGRHFEIFSHSSKRNGFAFHANCLHCMKCQIPFSW